MIANFATPQIVLLFIHATTSIYTHQKSGFLFFILENVSQSFKGFYEFKLIFDEQRSVDQRQTVAIYTARVMYLHWQSAWAIMLNPQYFNFINF